MKGLENIKHLKYGLNWCQNSENFRATYFFLVLVFLVHSGNLLFLVLAAFLIHSGPKFVCDDDDCKILTRLGCKRCKTRKVAVNWSELVCSPPRRQPPSIQPPPRIRIKIGDKLRNQKSAAQPSQRAPSTYLYPPGSLVHHWNFKGQLELGLLTCLWLQLINMLGLAFVFFIKNSNIS